eukprot:5514451-Prymnesium_polylepis.1
MALAWWQRRHGGPPFPVNPRGRPAADWWTRAAAATAPPLDAPFFTDAVGLVVRTAGVRALAQRYAAAAGLDPAE